MPKTKKPEALNTKEVLTVLARKIKIIDEHYAQLWARIDEIDDQIHELQERVYDAREVSFRSDFDWGDSD